MWEICTWIWILWVKSISFFKWTLTVLWLLHWDILEIRSESTNPSSYKPRETSLGNPSHSAWLQLKRSLSDIFFHEQYVLGRKVIPAVPDILASWIILIWHPAVKGFRLFGLELIMTDFQNDIPLRCIHVFLVLWVYLLFAANSMGQKSTSFQSRGHSQWEGPCDQGPVLLSMWNPHAGPFDIFRSPSSPCPQIPIVLVLLGSVKAQLMGSLGILLPFYLQIVLFVSLVWVYF